MIWTKEIRSFIAHCAWLDEESELAEEIREGLDFERWGGDIYLRCEDCGEVIPESARRLARTRETVDRQLRRYAVEVLGLEVSE